MARYPDLPTAYNIKNKEMNDTYNDLRSWSGNLINELETRDAEENDKPSTNIYSVVTITSIGRPRAGDVAYSASTGKFKGYVSTAVTQAWVDFN
tara:strand:- start:3032 stop:3313 length:282 start_codon:yes stop_codon:yes gene_type:complete